MLAIAEGGYTHLFAVQSNGQLLRLSNGAWSDVMPALSPDGSRLAFASNRDGFWDLYVMDLAAGQTTRLTMTKAYDGSPSWSNDGRWLAYESYVDNSEGGNLEIFIRPIDGSSQPIQLTDDPAADFSPAWSPRGRQVAFISTRSGENEVWLADLDQVKDRFKNISRDQNMVETHPAWSPDGTRLAWSAVGVDGVQRLELWDSSRPDDAARALDSGDWPAWSPQGDRMMASLTTPNQVYLTGYSLPGDQLTMPLLALNGPVDGITWGRRALPENLPPPLAAAAQITPAPLWTADLSQSVGLPEGRRQVVSMQGVQAPYAMLQDGVDESFNALRRRAADSVGWDFLATLEEAYIPLTTNLAPGMQSDWLYTGRAFRFNTAPVNASWVLVVREDFGGQTYWRIYLRARFQDGSQGRPLEQMPWNFAARLNDPLAYEQGGALEPVPSGYWLDFTSLAVAYGWERQPALSSWRQAYSSTRYNEFVLAGGLDWLSAMQEVYPRSALDTPTPVSSPTITCTATKTPTITPTATWPPWKSPTPTKTRTPWPTRTPTFTNTPRPTRTPTITPTPRPGAAVNPEANDTSTP